MTTRDVLLEAAEFVDSSHQGDGWPDPIAWDSRPLRVQARDLATVVESYLMNPHDERQERYMVGLLARLRRIARVR